ncbi:hypothetical protein GX51_06420 [Blastomyces parvus]|uniref:Uncharacterized protein n=1 Tax=Blastomyces parvus TaxID=2060905 RepID=A0A2B7WRQ8_9EURO|nr:hypothetical protein GX51_06420 [Blastomyces parvus]
MPSSVWTASLELEQGVLTSLSHWISSLFKMLAISLNPKPPHIQSSPDSDDSPPDDIATRPESINSFTPAPLPPPAASTSVSSSPLPPPLPLLPQQQQESQTPPNMLVKPAAPASISASPSHASSSGSKRPKLSLQTSSLPTTFGKSTTALSLALSAGCASSPTVRNTFNNAYDGFRRPASSSTAGASSPKCSSRTGKRSSSYLCNYQGMDDEIHIPYKLPLGLRSILRNSPLHTSSSLRRPPLAAQGSNGSGNGLGGRRVLFPAKRQVKYRCPLDEEIKTTRYTAKHSDLLSLDSPSGPSDVYTSSDEGEESDSSLSQPGSSSFSDDDEPMVPPASEENTRNNLLNRNASEDDASSAVKNSTSAPAAVERPRTAKRKHSTSERQIRAVALREDLASSGSGAYGYRDDTPKTSSFLHQRRKRQRKWRWTLGPIETGSAQQVNNGDNNTNFSNNPDPVVTMPDQATYDVTASNPPPEPKLMAVPTLSYPAPKRRPSPLVNTTTHPCIDAPAPPRGCCPQDPMCDILHKATSVPLPESLGSSPCP